MSIPPNSREDQKGNGSTDEISVRLAFLDLNDTDRRRTRQLVPLYDQHSGDFVEEFYRHLLRFEETARFLNDEQLVVRLKLAQREHLKLMLEADWGDQYLKQRRNVGRAHADVGIDPQWFLGAYNQYAQYCFRRFAENSTEETQQHIDQLLSVLKVIFLDIGLALDEYFAQSTQKLRHALEMLWQANTELRHFAQLASHDLKTPLATVANLCDEALDEFGDQIPPACRELVDAARNRTFRMSKMIDELLASNLSPEGSETNSEIESGPPLAEALERVRPQVEAKGISLSYPDQLPRVWGNRIRLQEAFYNLLSNAVKFTNAQNGRVGVSIEPRDDHYQFCFADNGPGIPPDEVERVFLPFRRLPQHGKLPGSGLGLYFTKYLIEHQEGRVWVESTVGKGSRFYVLLRRADR